MVEITPLPGPGESQAPFMYRVKGPEGIIDDYSTPGEARQVYNDLKLTLLPGEKASMHRCAHSSKPHPGGGPPGSDRSELWFNCMTDPQGMYEEYIAP